MPEIDSLNIDELTRIALASGLVGRIDREGRRYRIRGEEFDLFLDESKAKAFLRLIVFRADRDGTAAWAEGFA